jgi:hypothetical protein
MSLHEGKYQIRRKLWLLLSDRKSCEVIHANKMPIKVYSRGNEIYLNFPMNDYKARFITLEFKDENQMQNILQTLKINLNT